MYWNAGYQWHPGEKQNEAMHAKNQENKMVNFQTQITKFIQIKKKRKDMQRLHRLTAPSSGLSLLTCCCFHQQKEEGAIITEEKNHFEVKCNLLILKQKLAQDKWHNASQC